MFQVVVQVSKTLVCWGDRLVLLDNQIETVPDKNVKQTTVKKTCWKAGLTVTFFMGYTFNLSLCADFSSICEKIEIMVRAFVHLFVKVVKVVKVKNLWIIYGTAIS